MKMLLIIYNKSLCEDNKNIKIINQKKWLFNIKKFKFQNV